MCHCKSKFQELNTLVSQNTVYCQIEIIYTCFLWILGRKLMWNFEWKGRILQLGMGPNFAPTMGSEKSLEMLSQTPVWPKTPVKVIQLGFSATFEILILVGFMLQNPPSTKNGVWTCNWSIYDLTITMLMLKYSAGFSMIKCFARKTEIIIKMSKSGNLLYALTSCVNQSLIHNLEV